MFPTLSVPSLCRTGCSPSGSKELAAAGLLVREVVPTMPVQVTYRLTPSGSELMVSLQPLVQWGLRWHGQEEQERRVG